MDLEPLFKCVANAPPGVECGSGILVDVLDGSAPFSCHLGRHAADAGTVQPDFTRRLSLQPQEGAAERRLATARFAHQPNDLAGADRQAHASNRANRRDS